MRYLAGLALIGLACCMYAQAPPPPVATVPQYPVAMLSFSSPEQTPLGKKGAVMLGNTTCAPDGSLFLEMADSPAHMEFTLYSLTHGTDDVRYAASSVPGYKKVTLGFQYFAGNNGVVILAGGVPVDNSMNEGKRSKWVMLAVVYDRKGTLERAVPLPQNVDPKSIGMYGSGDLLVVTKDPVRNRLRLLVLDKDGDVKNELSLFDFDYDAGQKARNKQPLAKVLDAADLIQIFPDGDNLLLVPTGTAATVIEINEQGIVRATDLQLPPGYLMRSLLSINGAYWTVSAFDDAKILPEPTGRSAVFRNGPLFQFNSFDGSLIRRIDIPKNLKNNVLCAHDGQFTALTTDKDTGRLETVTGSVPQ